VQLESGQVITYAFTSQQEATDPHFQVFKPGSLWLIRGSTLDLSRSDKVLQQTILMKITKFQDGDKQTGFSYKVIEYFIKS
jgi:hypothetical protein